MSEQTPENDVPQEDPNKDDDAKTDDGNTVVEQEVTSKVTQEN